MGNRRMDLRVLVYALFSFLSRLSVYRLGGFDCYSGVCLRLRVEQPVQAMQPALVTLDVRTAKHQPSVAVRLHTEHWATLQGPVTIPEHAQVSDPGSDLGWSLEMRRGRTETFTAYAVFAPQGPAEEGYAGVVRAYATTPQGAIVRDSVYIHLDAEGRQVALPTRNPLTPLPLRMVTVTPGPSPTRRPTRTPLPTRTPRPTPVTLTITPTPSVTPTPRAYPAPTDAGRLAPAQRAATPAYPLPE